MRDGGCDGELAVAVFWRRPARIIHRERKSLVAIVVFYYCALLVLTLYSPKSHKLNFLRSLAEDMAPAFIPAWPR